MNTREYAKKYLSMGFSVFPIRRGLKVPTMSWERFQKEPMSLNDVDKLFNVDDNIALACGDVSGVMVVDQDDYKQKTKTPIALTSPLMVITPRGGLHVYFKHVEGTSNTVNRSMSVDIRSTGGYVLVPPSVVDLENGSKGVYMWNREPLASVVADLPEPPERALLAIYNNNTEKSAFSSFDVLSAVGVSEGGRNDALHKLALSSLNLLRGDETKAFDVVSMVNKTYSPPLPDNEVNTLFQSALKRYRVSPPISSSSVSTPPATFLPQTNTVGYKPSTVQDEYERILDVFINGRKMGISTGYHELDEIMGGFFPGQSYLLYADTSVGKSLLMVNMLISLIRRGVKCSYYDLENELSMTYERLILAAADGDIKSKDWKNAISGKNKDFIKKGMGLLRPLLDNLTVWDLNKLSERFGDANWAGVAQCLEEDVLNGVEVVVIDHLHYFSPAQSEHSVLGEVARKINNFCSVKGVAMLVVAHTRKGLISVDKKNGVENINASRPTLEHINGSSLISKHFKNIMALKRNSMSTSEAERSMATLFVDKTKYGPVGQFNLLFDERSLVFRADGIRRPLNDLNKEVVKTVDKSVKILETTDSKNVVPAVENKKVPFNIHDIHRRKQLERLENGGDNDLEVFVKETIKTKDFIKKSTLPLQKVVEKVEKEEKIDDFIDEEDVVEDILDLDDIPF